MRKFYLPSLVFLLVGAGCAYLRKVIVREGFDEKGLPIEGFWAITAVNVLIIVMLIAAIYIAIHVTKEYEISSKYSTAFASKSMAALIIKLICAVAFICGAAAVVIDMLDDVANKMKLVQIIAFTVTAFIGTIAFFMQAFSSYLGNQRPVDAYVGSFAAFALALRIIMIYFVNTTNPVIISYSFDCVALSASCLFVFLAAGWFTGKKQSRITIICGLVSTLFCLSGLVGNTISLGDKIICGAVGIYSTICTMSFFKNMNRIKRVF